MDIAVIIPAHNAALTIADTLESLLRQTHRNWEAVVVNDGSTDRTSEVIQSFAARDGRIREIQQPQSGVSHARNRGIERTHGDALLFLDADDWLKPAALESLANKLTSSPRFDVAYCGWAYVMRDGNWVFPACPREEGDLFAQHAQFCFSVIHTYLARRAVVQAVGQFDPSLRTCEDWDFWQRIARTGARFGSVPDILAAYRASSTSATRDGAQLLKDGLRVLATGHAHDSRVPTPHPMHECGLSSRSLPKAQYELACACGGLDIGCGRDGTRLLDLLHLECRDLDPVILAQCLVRNVLVSTGSPRGEWRSLWRSRQMAAGRFFTTLESRAAMPGFADSARTSATWVAAAMWQSPGLRRRGTVALGSLFLAYVRARKCHTSRCAAAFALAKHMVGKAPGATALRRRLQTRKKPQPGEQFESLFLRAPDPWNYSNDYERTKYDQTLSLLPAAPIADALELACAEGHFTTLLAPRVSRLLANDISRTALDRAAKRCHLVSNVHFQCFDFASEPIPGQYDLIVCSEVLYFVGDRGRLAHTAKKLTRSLKPGGHLIMAHGNVVSDEPSRPCFDWEHAFGAKTIGAVFARIPNLRFEKEIQTPLYRIQLFRRVQDRIEPHTRGQAAEVVFMDHGALPVSVAKQVLNYTPPRVVADQAPYGA